MKLSGYLVQSFKSGDLSSSPEELENKDAEAPLHDLQNQHF